MAFRIVRLGIGSPLLRLGTQAQCQISRRGAQSWVKKLRKEREIEETIFKHVGKHAKRADRLYVWGNAATGALGIKSFLFPEKGRQRRTRQFNPCRHRFFETEEINQKGKIYEAACGYGFSIFLVQSTSGCSVWGTGINTDSQLGYQIGIVQKKKKQNRQGLDYLTRPHKINLPFLDPINAMPMQASCGRAHTLIQTNEGIFSLGNNSSGQCGRKVIEGEQYKGSETVYKIPMEKKIKSIECGQDHSLLLTEDGQVLSCGLGADGQTGVGHFHAVETPTLVKGDIVGENIVHISSKADCVLAVSEKGDVFGWGNNEYSQLSSVAPNTTQVPIAKHLPFKNVGHVVKVAAAGSMCALLNDKGHVFVWGYGILGKGPAVQQSETPTQLPPPLFGLNEFNQDTQVVDITCGISNFATLSNQGDMYVWGSNKEAVLGLGHIKDQFFPLKASIPAAVQRVAFGVDHGVAVCKAYV